MSQETLKSEVVSQLLHDKNFAYLATIMSDGSPQVTPVWVDTDGEYVLINTAIGRLKYENVLRDSRVAVCVVDRNNPYNMVTIRGKVVEHTTIGAEEHIDNMAKKYLGLDKYPGRAPGERRVLLKIKPTKIFHAKYG
ncbi:MAG: PPOX class F420-dependent oxidoreductase [Nitrososphaera sp.]|jgi:PPOX class probable F420-dependent enzyme